MKCFKRLFGFIVFLITLFIMTIISYGESNCEMVYDATEIVSPFALDNTEFLYMPNGYTYNLGFEKTDLIIGEEIEIPTVANIIDLSQYENSVEVTTYSYDNGRNATALTLTKQNIKTGQFSKSVIYFFNSPVMNIDYNICNLGDEIFIKTNLLSPALINDNYALYSIAGSNAVSKYGALERIGYSYDMFEYENKLAFVTVNDGNIQVVLYDPYAETYEYLPSFSIQKTNFDVMYSLVNGDRITLFMYLKSSNQSIIPYTYENGSWTKGSVLKDTTSKHSLLNMGVTSKENNVFFIGENSTSLGDVFSYNADLDTWYSNNGILSEKDYTYTKAFSDEKNIYIVQDNGDKTFLSKVNISESIELLKGDVNLDGIITSSDCATLLQYVLDKDSISLTDRQLFLAKCSKTNEISSSDCAAILSKTLNKDFKF